MAHITQMYKWIITHTNTWVMIENIDTQNISLLENPLCISPSSLVGARARDLRPL